MKLHTTDKILGGELILRILTSIPGGCILPFPLPFLPCQICQMVSQVIAKVLNLAAYFTMILLYFVGVARVEH